MSEEASMLCHAANEAFVKKKYDDCLEYLKKLNGSVTVNQRKRDVNWALVSFSKSNWRQADQFRTLVSRLFPDDTIYSIKQNVQSLKIHAHLFYNLAVLSFHNGQYKSALQHLDAIRCPAENSLAVLATLLRIEIYLLLCQAEKVLTCMEDLDTLLDRDEGCLKNIENFSIRLQMYRARAYLCLKRFRAYKNFSKSFAIKQPWKEALFRAHLEYMTGSRPETALQILYKKTDGWDTTNPTESPAIILENVYGCIYGKLGKPNLAVVHFQRAIASASKNEFSRSLLSCPQPWSCSLMHNLGIAFLHAGQFKPAFECLLSVIQVFNRNPRLWHRLAECCIMAHKAESNESSFHVSRRSHEVVQRVAGYGPHKKAILKENLDAQDRSVDSGPTSGAIPDLSLEFASLCLRNAYALIPVIEGKDLDAAAKSLENGGEILEGRFPTFCAMPGSRISLTEAHRLRCSVLCASSYVYLCLGETQLALDYSMKLKHIPFVSPSHMFLCRLYGGEACILLEEWNLALEFLDPTQSEIKTLGVPELWSGYVTPARDWFPKTKEQARDIMVFNVAVYWATRKDFAKSFSHLESLAEGCMPIQAVMLGLYLQLVTGQEEAAKRYVINLLNPLHHEKPDKI